MQSRLTKYIGEDAYTIPRAVADVVRKRGLSGVIAPANTSTTHVALFPDNPNASTVGLGRIATGLRGLDYTRFDAHMPAVNVSFSHSPRNIPDITPNKYSPVISNGSNGSESGPKTYSEAVVRDSKLHGRVGGARYGGFAGGAISLIDGIATGSVDGKKVAIDTGLGAASAQTETMLARRADRLLGGSVMPPRVATGATAALEGNVGSALRPPSLIAGASAAGAVGAVVGGGLTAWHDADEVKSGRMTAGRATADVAVQTGIGLGSGVAGAAAGAAIGSVVPVIGTAAGAVVGFGVGVAASWAAQHSENIHAAQKEAGDYLTARFEKPLQQAWRPVSTAVDAVRSVGAGNGFQALVRAENAYVEPRQLLGEGAVQLTARGRQELEGAYHRSKVASSSAASSAGSIPMHQPAEDHREISAAADHARVEADRALWKSTAINSPAHSRDTSAPTATALLSKHASTGDIKAASDRSSTMTHAPAEQPAAPTTRLTASLRR